MTQRIRWGILGPGHISRKFAIGLRDAEGAELVAIGSRSPDRAAQFASEFGASRAHGSYDELANDTEVDAIYIGTPHSFHKEQTILCLRHGKHVLCEKPLAINAMEATEMVETARKEQRALMEAMWMRFQPAMVKVRELVTEGAIGDVRRVTADFGFRATFDPSGRLFDPHLGGGALLDVGIYPLSFAHMLLGEPAAISGLAHRGKTGVDEESAVLLQYKDGATAVLTSAIRLDTPCEAEILGASGWIRLPHRWWAATKFSIKKSGQEAQTLDLPFKGNLYTHEAEAFMDVIRSGKLESDLMSLDESFSIMQTMDAIRAQWGLKYPTE